MHHRLQPHPSEATMGCSLHKQPCQLKMQINVSSRLSLQLLPKSWSAAAYKSFPFISVQLLSYLTLLWNTILNIVPWLDNTASPRLLTQTPYSVAHISRKASPRAHPFPASHLKKMLLSISRRQLLITEAEFHQID